ncbi:MAG: hypothetical protein CV089_14755 [Nitrospira sp. WS110]|nr:hypothetical protein [Nitrospira sp. WS110]
MDCHKHLFADDRFNLNENPFVLGFDPTDGPTALLVLVEAVFTDIGTVDQNVVDPPLGPLMTADQKPLVVKMSGQAVQSEFLPLIAIQVALEYPFDHDRLSPLDC